jgi:hypothetical protein
MMGSLANALKAALRDGAQDGLMDLGRDVLHEAQRLVPKGDPATDPDPSVSLADSGIVVPVNGGVVIDFQTAYAAKQHEDLRLKHPRGGNARFLEVAIASKTGALERVVGQAVRVELAGSGDRKTRRRRDGVSRPGVGNGALPDGAA